MTAAAGPALTAAPRVAPLAVADGSRVAPRSALVSLSAGVVGLLSYACTLLMAHVLSPPEYSDYAAGQMLVGVVGIVAAALVPLPLVHIVRSHPRGSEGRRRGMAFAWSVSAAAGVVAAVVTGAVAAVFAPPPMVGAVAASALALFAISPVWGWMQGELRFVRYAVTTMAEVGIRLAFSVAAVLLGWGATGALTGFIVGATVVLLAGLGALYRDLAWRPRVITEKLRWTETGDIALTQLVISTLIGADVVLVALVGNGAPDAAGYQALATLAKGPVYVAAGTVLVAFPLLRSNNARVEDILREALRSFGRLALPTAAVLTTVPTGLALLVLPQRYAGSLVTLPWLAAAGLGYATLTVLATVMLALRAYRRSQLGLLVASLVVPAGLVLGWRIDGIHGLAVGCALGALTATAVLAVIASPLLPSGTAWRAVMGLARAAVLLAALQLARPHPTLWLIAVAATGAVLLRGMRQRRIDRPSATGGLQCLPTPHPPQMRILHLGFEDPAMPGAGGGSLRTHEINRRLADRDSVTVLVQRFPGWTDRIQDGVRYVHIGIGSGRTRLTRLLGYLAGLPLAVRHQSADLVVEDFFAPISTLGAPLWTGRPTIGVVQWLNAGDKARQYKLPFQFVERFGVRRHHRLIAVSDGVAERLWAMNPRLTVDVIGNGVAAEAFQPAPRMGENVVFIGRLETAQKGLDLLLQAWALACHNTPGQLIIAGQGPDEHRLRLLATDLGVAHRVRFVGWVSGRAKYELLSSARIVAVPSRFETFGIVALEALATGTPVVAFDIPCLREVIPNGCGQRVAPFDVAAYSAALTARYRDHHWIAGAAPRARAFAARFDWDTMAERQRAVYAAEASSPRRGDHQQEVAV
jgi:glycosyltransferase involved in cell wall biosynthesis/O-antigen/teichoic acid export membrane protein